MLNNTDPIAQALAEIRASKAVSGLSWATKKNVNIEPVINIMDFPYLGDLVVE